MRLICGLCHDLKFGDMVPDLFTQTIRNHLALHRRAGEDPVTRLISPSFFVIVKRGEPKGYLRWARDPPRGRLRETGDSGIAPHAALSPSTGERDSDKCVSCPIRLTAPWAGEYRRHMARRRVRLTSRWPTLAETARVFKISAARQRRLSREVAKYMEKYKDTLAAANGRSNAVKPRRSAARKAMRRPARVSPAR